MLPKVELTVVKHLRLLKKIYNLTLLTPLFVTSAIILSPQIALAQTAVLQTVPNNFAAVEADCEGETLDSGNCGIVKWLLIFTNVMAGLVGIVVVIMVIIGGIQYSTAADDAQKIQEAKKKVSNALFALLAFIFMYAFLQWVVPGGIF